MGGGLFCCGISHWLIRICKTSYTAGFDMSPRSRGYIHMKKRHSRNGLLRRKSHNPVPWCQGVDSVLTEPTTARWRVYCCRALEVPVHSNCHQQSTGQQRHPNHHPPGTKDAGVLAHHPKEQREEHKGHRGEGTYP